jgi:hypothetical protein
LACLVLNGKVLKPWVAGINLILSKPKPRQMIDLVRLHAYKAGEFFLVDVPKKEARKKRIELNKDGFVIAHTELV